MTLPDPLAPLAAHRQFILYKLVPKPDGKTDKLPVHPQTLQVVTAHDPSAWVDADTASVLAMACGADYGVAFVFTENDPFFFIDIDNCVQDGQWTPVAQDLMNRFRGAAVEISQSGAGLHIFGTYRGAAPEHACKNKEHGLELYTSSRFVALTGDGAIGDAALDCTAPLRNAIETYYPPTMVAAGDPEGWRDGPVPEWSGPEDDDILIAKMLGSKSAGNVFGKRASVADLWNNNETALALAYPSLNDRDPYDRSSADAALASHLAWWTGKDHERITRLMWKSGLVREKWTRHKTYLREMTITRAINGATGVFNGGGSKPLVPQDHQPVDISEAVTAALEPTLTAGQQFLTVSQLTEYFAGCIYIQDRHRILTSNGTILRPDQFKATFGGYEFTIDAENGKSTRNAWEAFVENQAVRFPKVSTTCFRPSLAPGAVISEESRTMVNTYVPIHTRRQQGDVTPFLDHLSKLFPDPRDREIVLSYMAALVQYPGVKFQWAPLIQGGEGNGKSLIMRALAFAVGSRYTHLPNAQDLGSQFNGWLLEKLLIGVEEIFISHKRELIERIKPLVTNERVEVQQKGVDQLTADNYANWMLFTNHKDALIISEDGRRYAVFFTPQQTAVDLTRWGMSGDYFPNLYRWLNALGYEYVNDFLHSYQIADEFNPAAACQRAPVTTSTDEAISLSLGSIEQEIMEAVDQGRPGFAGGWISSRGIERLLTELGLERKIPPTKRRLMLQQMGYDWHPALNKGRVNNVIVAEGCKPRLFIKSSHESYGLTIPADVTAHYLAAQKYPVDLEVNKS